MSSENKEEHNSTPPDVKEEEDLSQIEEPKALDDSSKDSTKESIKEESVKDEDSEDDDNEEEMALLDRPVEVTGCRARKKVDRLELSFKAAQNLKVEIPEGKGQKLVDFPRIDQQIQKSKLNELKPLHRLLFNKLGSGIEVKRNIRKFCGYTFDKSSPIYLRKKKMIEKYTLPVLKNICLVLDLERSGTKEDVTLRILEFLLNPKESGKKDSAKRETSKKKASSKDKRKSTEKKTKNSERKSKGKKDTSDDEPESQDDSAADVSEGSSGADDDDDDDDDGDDVSDDEPKKKPNASKPKEATPKTKGKKSDKSGDKQKKQEKKTPAKASKRKRDEESESSEDEPRAKNKMPSDEEITKLVKQILDSADLQEITMKKVIKQVADAYPDFDLSHKKAFIKTTIKSVIS